MAAISKNGKNVIPEVTKMLSALTHRGNDFHGIATDKVTLIERSLSELIRLSESVISDIAIGCNSRILLSEDNPQPIEIDNLKVILDGRIYSPLFGKSEIYRLLRHHGVEGVEKIIAETEGSFALAILSGKRLILGRDCIGAVPLYFSENGKLLAFASERKALWRIGMRDEDIRSFPPGNVAEIRKDKIFLRQVKVIEKPKDELINAEEGILETLHTLLSEAVKRRLYGLDGRVSVAFSGGLDSSIIAALLKMAHVDALLITVGLEGSKDLEHAENVAREIGLRFKAETYTIEDVKETLPKVLWLIEEANGLKASIKIPEYWAAEVSLKMNHKIMFLGEGADELFGGYYKYLREYKRSMEEIKTSLFLDVASLYKSLESSEKIFASHGMEARFPYADYELTMFALKIPVLMKISSENDSLRKRILRRYAEYICLPVEVYLRPKKAIQYGTGVSRALKKIAKKNGLNVQALINKIFEEIKSTYISREGLEEKRKHV